MGNEAGSLMVTLNYEGEERRFRLSKPLPSAHKGQLQLTGVVYETWPRQFEVKCNCGCGYQGIAYLVEEQEQAERNLR